MIHTLVSFLLFCFIETYNSDYPPLDTFKASPKVCGIHKYTVRFLHSI